ncbi:MAG: hypothetical protein ACLPVO_17450, partial [Desulfomonilaceae bacterium]
LSEISYSERWGLADVTLPITYLPKKHWGAIYQILKKIANWYKLKSPLVEVSPVAFGLFN